MKSQESTSGNEHHYWPEGLIPITPQAREFGFTMPVYVSPRTWKQVCVWGFAHGHTNTELRVCELVKACYRGLSKALATQDDMLFFTFKHWYLSKRIKAKKRLTVKLGARLLLHPETDEPWLLIFDPEYDYSTQLKKGEPSGKPEENRTDEGIPGSQGDGDGAELDPN